MAELAGGSFFKDQITCRLQLLKSDYLCVLFFALII